MGTILGIDLGTTNSLCSVFSDGEPRLVPNSSGSFLTPSVVGLLESGEVVVGDAARQLAITRPDRCAAFFKRSMGTDKKLELGDKTFTPQELSSLVLRSLREDAAAHLGAEVVDAVVTVPAYFNDLQREATRAAAELAGLRVRRMVNEPTAAALTYGLLDRDSDKRVLVIDLGGGTFDVTLLEVFEGTLEIVSTAGQNHLGGEDFTDRLAVLALQSQDLQLETEEFKNPLRVARLRMECEEAKRQLTTAESASIRMPSEDGTMPDEPRRFEIDRAAFAQACDRLVDRLGGPIERALRDGRTRTAEVDEVILVGGATRMPIVQEFVADRISRAPLCTIDPDLVVGMGASVQAALIIDDSAVDDLVMTDVCPFTLGVEISKLIGTQVRDGYYLPIIHRNTTIPVSKEEIVSTLHTNQSEVLVRVHQGEARRAEDNLLLGTLKVTGIPPGPPGLPISLRFTYDGNGMLEVEAIIEQTGKRFSTIFTHNVRGLSAEALERARKELDSLKFYPRDEIEHRRLLLFAEAAVGRVAMHWRSELEEAVDLYEHALHGTDPEAFAAARSMLLQRLSLIGDPFETQEDGERDD